MVSVILVGNVMDAFAQTEMIGLSIVLFVIAFVLSFTADRKWKIIRKQEKRIDKLEKQAIEKEELLRILDININ